MPTAAASTGHVFAEVFSPAQSGVLPASPSDKDALLETIRTLALQIQKLQGSYQPIYGLEEIFGQSTRQSHLTDNCAFVEKHFAGNQHKQHVHILDIGCNNGYVSFHLARSFPHVVGFEINPPHLELCRSLAAYHDSTARFFNQDLLSLMDSGEADLVNVDCVLLFNVVHQLIFARSLGYVKTFLARLTRQVDVVFVELATRSDYKPHGKDHLLPTDPAEVLSECRDCDIELLKKSPRPLYALRRRRVRIGGEDLCVTGVHFSEHPNAAISRKYYAFADRFMKVIRFTPLQHPVTFHAEVGALLKVRGKEVGPRLLDWQVNASAGVILMERIYGPPLNTCLAEFADDLLRKRILGEMLRIGAVIHKAGFFQNDFSAHNFILTAPGQLRLLDFEQSRQHPIFDHFAFLLWIVNDLYKQAPQSYEKRIYEHLQARPDSQRASPRFYPDLRSLKSDGFLRDFIEAAETAASWGAFVVDWAARFATYLTNASEINNPKQVQPQTRVAVAV